MDVQLTAGFSLFFDLEDCYVIILLFFKLWKGHFKYQNASLKEMTQCLHRTKFQWLLYAPHAVTQKNCEFCLLSAFVCFVPSSK